MKTTLKRFIASLMLAILTAVPTYAGCDPDMCLGPCVDEELLYNTTFNFVCPQWVKTGSAHQIWIGSNGLMELNASGAVSQTVSTGSYRSMYVAFDVSVTATNPGTERLYVEILRGYYVVETVEVIYPNDGGGNFRMYIGNYSNEPNLKMRFRYVAGTAPGNTVYRIDNAAMWGNFV